jgi:hypothetical protein
MHRVQRVVGQAPTGKTLSWTGKGYLVVAGTTRFSVCACWALDCSHWRAGGPNPPAFPPVTTDILMWWSTLSLGRCSSGEWAAVPGGGLALRSARLSAPLLCQSTAWCTKHPSSQVGTAPGRSADRHIRMLCNDRRDSRRARTTGGPA